MSGSSASVSSVHVLGVSIPVNPSAVAGFAAGFVSSALLYPLEIVKSRFQVGTHGRFSYKSTMNALHAIYSTHGLKELYRGFPAGLVGSSISWGLYFYLYNSWKFAIAAAHNQSEPGALDHWTSSILASMAVQTLLCPIWVVKLNQQLGQFDGFWSGGVRLHKAEGIKGLYRGLIPGYWTCSHLAVQFVLYEKMMSSGLMDSLTLNTVLATVVSKSVATITTSPIEVVKVRLRSSTVAASHNIRSLCREIWTNEGLRGFYRGVGTALIRILPGQCLTFVTYETVRALFAS